MKNDFSEVMNTLTGIQDYLLQVAVYADFQPQCIIILEKDPPNIVEALSSLRDYAHKRKLRFPLVVTQKFIDSSLDSFPLEFLNITASNYENLFIKNDILKELKYEPANIRLQMEREIKGKWLLVRLSVLEKKNTPKQLANLLALTLDNIVPVLKGICYLQEGSVPQTLEGLFQKSTIITAVDFDSMLECVAGKEATLANVKQYLSILEDIMYYIEHIKL